MFRPVFPLQLFDIVAEQLDWSLVGGRWSVVGGRWSVVGGLNTILRAFEQRGLFDSPRLIGFQPLKRGLCRNNGCIFDEEPFLMEEYGVADGVLIGIDRFN